MARRTANAKRSSYELEIADGGVLARRQTGFLPDATFWFEDALDLKGVLTAPVITCQAWLLELYALQAGAVRFVRGPGT